MTYTASKLWSLAYSAARPWRGHREWEDLLSAAIVAIIEQVRRRQAAAAEISQRVLVLSGRSAIRMHLYDFHGRRVTTDGRLVRDRQDDSSTRVSDARLEVEDMLSRLAETRRRVVSQRYGLFGEPVLSASAIADNRGSTREAVYQHLRSALREMAA